MLLIKINLIKYSEYFQKRSDYSNKDFWEKTFGILGQCSEYRVQNTTQQCSEYRVPNTMFRILPNSVPDTVFGILPNSVPNTVFRILPKFAFL